MCPRKQSDSIISHFPVSLFIFKGTLLGSGVGEGWGRVCLGEKESRTQHNKLKRDESYELVQVEPGCFTCVRTDPPSGFRIPLVSHHRMCVRTMYNVFK